jgi:uncharacterized protein (TIGR03067 family)
MKAVSASGLLLLFAVSLAPAEEGKDDLAKLQGNWLVEKDGKKAEFKFAKDTFTLTFDGKESYKGTFKIDATKKPRQMDLTVKEGPNFQGQTALAIYEVDGDSFKWNANRPGADDRPKSFPEKEGQGEHLYLVFKRVK